MSDLIRLVLDCFRWFNPFVTVHTFERGVRFRWGRVVRVEEPGLHWATPGMADIVKVSTARFPSKTRKLDITLRDDSILTFSATATVVVVDPIAAYCRYDHYKESVDELMERVLVEELAEADVDRFDPTRRKRKNLVEELTEAVNVACDEYGMKVLGMGFTHFYRNVKTVRLLVGQAVLGTEAGKGQTAA